MRANHKLEIVVPDEPPVLTPELSRALLRLLLQAEPPFTESEQPQDLAS